MTLERIKIRNAEIVSDPESGTETFQVFDPHAFVQAAGYLKFRQAHLANERIFFRGQRKLYSGLQPSLYRGLSRQRGGDNQMRRFNSALAVFRKTCRIFENLPKYSHEPLLQHYGLHTSWVDLVDNIWVALWFACHAARTTGRNGEHLHFERRNPSSESNRGFAYVLLVGADIGNQNDRTPGYWRGKFTELIDLRMACPSVFLRPHSQHGLLFRRKGNEVTREFEYDNQIRGIIRISLEDALTWLGDADTLNVHSLFPPPFYDAGYQIWLSAGYDAPHKVGAIAHIGA